MHQLLYGQSTRSIAVLHGFGGIGKTQLAIQYWKRHKDEYTAIFWINANDQVSLKQSFIDVAQQILKAHPSASALANLDWKGSLDSVVDAVKAWLSIEKNKRWLIIYDNYDNPKLPENPDLSAIDIRKYLPASDHGSIIVTTRSSRVTIGSRIHIQKLLDIQNSLEILSNSSGRKDITNGMIPANSK
jgi:ATP/maltotriose-dependent transcriptional regulator MalT